MTNESIENDDSAVETTTKAEPVTNVKVDLDKNVDLAIYSK